MTTTVGSLGYGVLFRRSGATDTTYSLVGEVKAIDGLHLTRETTELTNTQSTSDYREFVGGQRDGGQLTVQIALVPSSSATQALGRMFSDYGSDTALWYQITWPNSSKTYWKFQALVVDISHSMPIDGEMILSVTFKISGVPTLANGWT